MKKSILPIITAIIMCLSTPLTIHADYGVPVFDVEKISEEELVAGQTYELEIDLKNDAYHKAYKVSPKIEIPEGTPITVLDLSNSLGYVTTLNANSTMKLTCNIEVDPLAEPGTYPINITGYAQSTKGDDVNIKETFNVEIVEPDTPDQIAVSLVSTQSVSADSTFEANISIENISDSDLNDFTVEVEGLSPDTITNKGDTTIEFLKLIPSGTANAVFTLYANSSLKNGVYPVDFNITYTQSDNVKRALTKTIYFEINTESDILTFNNLALSKTTLVPTEGGQLTFTINNDSSQDVENITLTFSHDNNLIPISQSTLFYDTIAANTTKDVVFNFKAAEDAPTKNYPIEVKATYNDVTLTQYSGVYVDGNQEILTITAIKPSKTVIVPNETVTVSATIENLGKMVKENITVTASQSSELIPTSNTTILIGVLEAGASKTIQFTYKATDSAKSSNYPVEIKASTGNNSVNQYTGIYISNDDDDDDDDAISQPRLIIDEFNFGSEKLFTGDTFNFDFNIKNTNASTSVKNLKVTITTLDTRISSGNNATQNSTALLPVGQSNSFFIDTLKPSAGYNASIPYKVLESADAAVYTMQFNFEYEDLDGNSFKDSDEVMIPIYEESSLSVSDVSVGTVLDNAFTLEVDFYNTGNVDLNNMMIDIEGDFTTSNSNYYVGDFTTGSMDVYDVQVQGSVPDSLSGTIIFTYENTFGETQLYEKPFQIGNSNDTDAKQLGAGSGDGSAPAGTGARPNGKGGMNNLSEEQRESLQNMSNEERREAIAAMANGEEFPSTVNDTSTAKAVSIALIALVLLGGIGLFLKKKVFKRKVD